MSIKPVIRVFLTVLSGEDRLLVQNGMDVLIPLLPHAIEMIAGKGH